MMYKKMIAPSLLIFILVGLLSLYPVHPGAAEAGLFQRADRITAFAIAVEGEYIYIAGEASSLAGSMPPGALDLGGGMKDIFLAKLRTDGTLLYSALIGGSNDDSAYAIAVRQGVVYLLGETWSDDFPNAPGNAGESDAVLLALAADGSQVLWARRFGGSGQDAGRALAFHAGSLYLAGVTWSEDLGSGTSGLGDGFAARVGLDGRQEWLSVFGGRTLDVAFDLAVGDSGVWIAGQSLSTDFGGVQQGSGDAFVTRFSLGGVQQFANLYGGRAEDMAYGITLAGDGGVYLVGGTESAGLTPAFGTFGGGFDGFMMKISADGTLQSTSYLGGPGADYAHDVLPLADGGSLVFGVTFSQTFPLGYARSATGTGRSNAFITHMASSGDLVNAWLVGGPGDDQAYAAALTPQGLWLAGRFSTGPLGYALFVPPSGIPGVPLPGNPQPLPTATLALTATARPTETPRATATFLPTATPLPVMATPTFSAVEEQGVTPIEVETQPAELLDPTTAAQITGTVAAALTQGTPADAITVVLETPTLTATALAVGAAVPPVAPIEGENGGFPIGLVGGGLLLAAGVGGLLFGLSQKRKTGGRDLTTRQPRNIRRRDQKPSDSDQDLLL